MGSDDVNGGKGAVSSVGKTIVPSAGGRRPPAAAAEPMIGQILDNRYRIVDKLGEGGMGEVYACEHIGLKKMRAVKLLRPEIVSNEEAVRRFHQEAQSASSIGHRNIIEIVDIGELGDGRVYMCMEFLEGKPLSELIKTPIDVARALNILIQTCHGLAAAHRQQIIHRDMKPENIFVTFRDGSDVPKILDFGIAKVSGNDGQNNLTRTGAIFGTPYYMAPEQALGQTVDHRADIYSLGVIMYEVFCGAVPFQADSFMAILTQHITSEPMAPEEMAAKHGRSVPAEVVTIINRCMSKAPEDRYPTMDDLTDALVGAYRAGAGSGMSAYYDAQFGYQSGATAPAHGMVPASDAVPPPGQGAAAAASSTGDLVAAAPSRRRGMLLGVAVVLVIAASGAGAYVALRPAGAAQNEPADPPMAAAQPQVPVADVPAPVDAPAAPSGRADTDRVQTPPDAPAAPRGRADTSRVRTPPAAPPEATEPPPVVKQTVLVNSKPQRAEVVVDGQVIGVTPLNVEVVAGQPLKLTLVRDGFADASLVLDGARTKVTQTLKRERRRSGRGGASDRGGRGNRQGLEDGLLGDDSDQLE
jgi:eukaryotic-like serine/threonine-protein kinase